MVKAIESMEEFHAIIAGAEPVVIDFYADWCGPCRYISPIFDKFETDFPTIKFYRVDIDAQSGISHEVNIKSVPTFIAYQRGYKIFTIVGASAPELLEGLKKIRG